MLEVVMGRRDRCKNCKQLRELKAENRSLRRRITTLNAEDWQPPVTDSGYLGEE